MTDKPDIDAVRRRAPLRTYHSLVESGCPNEWITKGSLFVIVKRGASRRIDEDDPSIFGSHLLGHEGEWAQLVTIEERRIVEGDG